MDTLWLAGEKKEFARCLEWVDQNLDLNIDQASPKWHTLIGCSSTVLRVVFKPTCTCIEGFFYA